MRVGCVGTRGTYLVVLIHIMTRVLWLCRYQYNVVYAASKKAADLTFLLDCGFASTNKKRRLDKCSIFTGTPDDYKVKARCLSPPGSLACSHRPSHLHPCCPRIIIAPPHARALPLSARL